MTSRAGLVSLVGAGPGDPELITVKGLRRLQTADAVVYDRLVSAELLELVPEHAEIYDVGKLPGAHKARQQEINELLVALGRRGLRVVRLKGGDPFVFGRGGEEALELARWGVPCEIVPGVSSAVAVPASAGIPVTHRGLAASFTVVTGHSEVNGEEQDWRTLAGLRGTLVFLMGVENLSGIAEQLVRHGRAGSEPAAVIQDGTTPQQRVLVAPLAEIGARAQELGIRPPATFVVGPTVQLAKMLGKLDRAVARVYA